MDPHWFAKIPTLLAEKKQDPRMLTSQFPPMAKRAVVDTGSPCHVDVRSLYAANPLASEALRFSKSVSTKDDVTPSTDVF